MIFKEMSGIISQPQRKCEKKKRDKRNKLCSTLVGAFLEQLCKFPGCCAFSLLF